jgi:hypothetical protein
MSTEAMAGVSWTCSETAAAECVRRGWLSPEAAAIAATEPLEQWLMDVVVARGRVLSRPLCGGAA